MRTSPVIAAVLLLAGCTTTGDPPERSCGSPVSTNALPTWARAGFSWDGRGMEHVVGEQTEIVAILFGAPLSSPPAEDHSNKILWMSRQVAESPGDLKITGVLDGTDVRAEHTVSGGPGPSIIDMPRAGCWRLTLSWSGRTDTMELIYGAPAPAS